MDPNQAVRDVVQFIQNEEYEEAIFVLEALMRWSRSGGFSPTISFQEVSS